MTRYLRQTSNSALRGTAILRLDFNTKDEWRMERSIPTIKFLLKRKLSVVILSHRGRPKQADPALSLKKDASDLQSLLGHRVTFISHFRFKEIAEVLKKAKPGSVFLLENLRFVSGEEKNDRALAKKLASLGNFYVNDAFAVSHRSDASVVAITKYLRSYVGLELEREIVSLSKVLKNPARPLAVILGGGKVHDKLGVLDRFRRKADYFLIGGAAANTLLHLKGMDVKDSVIDRDAVDQRKFRAVLGYKNLVLPTDYRFAERRILDIGGHTIQSFVVRIKKSRTVIWSGPLGMIEREPYDFATKMIAEAVAGNRRAFSVVGGGETVTFLKKHGLDRKINFVSTGGGAMLDFLAGEKLPGIEALKKSR
jgi:phosphoglycerate kinase